MKILVINVVSENCYISLINGDKQVICRFEKANNTSERLLPEIDSLLKKNKVKLQQLDAIMVCEGPGSFTGIRVGIATVKGFALGTNVKVIGFNLFDLFRPKLATAIKASGAGFYVKDGKELKVVTSEELKSYKKRKLQVFENEEGYFEGYNLESVNMEDATFVLAEELVKAGAFITANQLNPMYLLKSQAERELDGFIANAEVKLLDENYAEKLHEIEKQCFTENVYSEKVFKNLENKILNGIFVNKKLVGYALLGKVGDELELEKIAILPKMRGFKLGKRLLSETLKNIKFSKCFLEVNKNNKVAINLYKGLGFAEVSTRKAYYENGDDAVIMQLAVEG